MRKIEVDNEVYAYLESKVSTFSETPNQVLRRILHLDTNRQKKPNADLSVLVKVDLLNENQQLFLHDYQGNRIPGYEATLSQGALFWKNKSYSMSELAKIFLKEKGYRSNAVRGPAHWYTSDGISIKDIWDNYLKKNQETCKTNTIDLR